MVRTHYSTLRLALLAVVLSATASASRSFATPHDFLDVFAQFTQHIRRQTDSDKIAFSKASQCMNWFYRRQRQKPAPPPVQGVVWNNPGQHHHRLTQSSSECDTQYPGGLDAVRKDFQRTQSSLSVSLTFYEFALVGDKDDNNTYSMNELQDILHALELPVDTTQGTAAHLQSLTGTFDSIHTTRHMEALMKSMGTLYDQGYRFTSRDKANLDRLMK
ncbi:MAG: hypothetical protein ABW047_14340 [Nitrospiraceae bacterium]